MKRPRRGSRAEKLQTARAVHQLSNGRYTLVGGDVLVQVHAPTEACFRYGCAIHHPTDPNPDWPQRWSWGVMYRVCPCGHLFHDHDDRRFRKRHLQRGTFLRSYLPKDPDCGCR